MLGIALLRYEMREKFEGFKYKVGDVLTMAVVKTAVLFADCYIKITEPDYFVYMKKFEEAHSGKNTDTDLIRWKYDKLYQEDAEGLKKILDSSRELPRV